MPSFLDDCEEHFNTRNLYDVLKVSKTANGHEVKRAYRKRSLEVHPDRVPDEEKEVATEKFKALGRVYSILSDSEKRSAYDDTGSIDEDDDVFEDNKNWAEYWRSMFSKLTIAAVKKFENEYKGSKEELEDVKQSYLDGKGEMDYILSNVLCTTIEDEPRLRKLLERMIESEEIPAYTSFTKESKAKTMKRQRKYAREAKEADELAKELNIDKSDNLTALIRKRNAERSEQAEGFLDSLAAKYAPKSKKRRVKANANGESSDRTSTSKATPKRSAKKRAAKKGK